MSKKLLFIKNAESKIPSWTEAFPISRVDVSVAIGPECKAVMKASGETFTGKGESVLLAVTDLASAITKAAIKPSRRGRTPDRVRVAASLLQGGML